MMPLRSAGGENLGGRSGRERKRDIVLRGAQERRTPPLTSRARDPKSHRDHEVGHGDRAAISRDSERRNPRHDRAMARSGRRSRPGSTTLMRGGGRPSLWHRAEVDGGAARVAREQEVLGVRINAGEFGGVTRVGLRFRAPRCLPGPLAQRRPSRPDPEGFISLRLVSIVLRLNLSGYLSQNDPSLPRAAIKN